jgi:hypothetical protein
LQRIHFCDLRTHVDRGLAPCLNGREPAHRGIGLIERVVVALQPRIDFVIGRNVFPGIIRVAAQSIGQLDGCIKKLVPCCDPGQPGYREERRIRILVNLIGVAFGSSPLIKKARSRQIDRIITTTDY